MTNAEKLKCRTIRTQPPRKLAASAAQALCKCLASSNVGILSGDLGAGVHKRPRLGNHIFDISNFRSSILPKMSLSIPLTSTWDEGPLY